MRGNPLLEKRCSAHGEHASVLHRGVSRAVSLKMHVGPTPSGPAPLPARTFIWGRLSGLPQKRNHNQWAGRPVVPIFRHRLVTKSGRGGPMSL
jgi:hypothetical protein